MDDVRYTDGVVTIRRPRLDDLDTDLEAKDDEQMRWLWEPGQREAWEAMTALEQRDHAKRSLHYAMIRFGPGPKWVFAVDASTASSVAYVDCDLAHHHVPHGQANIAYACHPDHRGRGYVSRAVRLINEFLRDQTSATESHLLIDARNVASVRVATAVGATAVEQWVTDDGCTMIRHVIQLRDVQPNGRGGTMRRSSCEAEYRGTEHS